MAKHARGKSRVVLAPEPELMTGQLAPNRVLSVKLKPGEEVEWLWTSIPGGRYVSGYRIVGTRRPRNRKLKLWNDKERNCFAAD
jgi:hypothetical protein